MSDQIAQAQSTRAPLQWRKKTVKSLEMKAPRYQQDYSLKKDIDPDKDRYFCCFLIVGEVESLVVVVVSSISVILRLGPTDSVGIIIHWLLSYIVMTVIVGKTSCRIL